MSHKYYGFQKDEQDSLYAVPFLSTKVQRLRFLNEDFVGYADQNEFIIHKNPGLTIVRVNDNVVNQGLHKQSSVERLMNEFLNQLVYKSTDSLNLFSIKKTNSVKSTIKIKEVAINLNSSIRISMSNL